MGLQMFHALRHSTGPFLRSWVHLPDLITVSLCKSSGKQKRGGVKFKLQRAKSRAITAVQPWHEPLLSCPEG